MKEGVFSDEHAMGSDWASSSLVPLQTTPAPQPQPNPWAPVAERLPEWLPLWAVQWGLALFILAVGVYLSKLLVRLLGRHIARRFARQSVAQTVLRAIRVVTIVFSLFLAASVIGLRVGNIVLSVTVFSAVVGVILAPIVGSVINGLFVLADQPYEIGDMIELDNGTKGFVDDITIRYTKIFTLDNTFMVIPNSTIRERDVTNYSAEDERTRLSLELLVTYESDIDQARELIERGAQNCDDVITGGPDIRIGSARYPAKPTCYIDEHGDHGILLNLRYWAKKPFKQLRVRSRVQENVRQALAESDADVEFAYPHQHHVFDETSGQAQVRFQRAGQATESEGTVAFEGQSVEESELEEESEPEEAEESE